MRQRRTKSVRRWAKEGLAGKVEAESDKLRNAMKPEPEHYYCHEGGTVYTKHPVTGEMRKVDDETAARVMEQRWKEDCEAWVHSAVDEATNTMAQIRGELPEGYAAGVLEWALMAWTWRYWKIKIAQGELRTARTQVNQLIVRKVYEDNPAPDPSRPALTEEAASELVSDFPGHAS